MILDTSIKSLGELIKSLDEGANEAMSVAKATIDAAAKEVYDELKRTTPKRTGGLVNSLVIEPTTTKQYVYGKKVRYDGYDEQGRPYQLIANSLNIGEHRLTLGKGYLKRKYRGRTKQVQFSGANLFINFAESKLRGLSDRIRDRIVENINDKIK